MAISKEQRSKNTKNKIKNISNIGYRHGIKTFEDFDKRGFEKPFGRMPQRGREASNAYGKAFDNDESD